jgi:hypothetical protein
MKLSDIEKLGVKQLTQFIEDNGNNIQSPEPVSTLFSSLVLLKREDSELQVLLPKLSQLLVKFSEAENEFKVIQRTLERETKTLHGHSYELGQLAFKAHQQGEIEQAPLFEELIIQLERISQNEIRKNELDSSTPDSLLKLAKHKAQKMTLTGLSVIEKDKLKSATRVLGNSLIESNQESCVMCSITESIIGIISEQRQIVDNVSQQSVSAQSHLTQFRKVAIKATSSHSAINTSGDLKKQFRQIEERLIAIEKDGYKSALALAVVNETTPLFADAPALRDKYQKILGVFAKPLGKTSSLPVNRETKRLNPKLRKSILRVAIVGIGVFLITYIAIDLTKRAQLARQTNDRIIANRIRQDGINQLKMNAKAKWEEAIDLLDHGDLLAERRFNELSSNSNLSVDTRDLSITYSQQLTGVNSEEAVRRKLFSLSETEFENIFSGEKWYTAEFDHRKIQRVWNTAFQNLLAEAQGKWAEAVELLDQGELRLAHEVEQRFDELSSNQDLPSYKREQASEYSNQIKLARSEDAVKEKLFSLSEAELENIFSGKEWISREFTHPKIQMIWDTTRKRVLKTNLTELRSDLAELQSAGKRLEIFKILADVASSGYTDIATKNAKFKSLAGGAAAETQYIEEWNNSVATGISHPVRRNSERLTDALIMTGQVVMKHGQGNVSFDALLGGLIRSTNEIDGWNFTRWFDYMTAEIKSNPKWSLHLRLTYVNGGRLFVSRGLLFRLGAIEIIKSTSRQWKTKKPYLE